ncbi:tumor necrosis factor ligand superfamily member 13 isoform X1 [Scleropages formosus]|uniref:TNF superfamily member 13 n=1 Tax=Scleropages formosus TaxID=113540 RepID=A0A8D0CIG2_SCLFO|nr:tumor necrosis factor ligand superfamily member 13-like isoform X1 [Scleropages formosus]
MARLRTRVATPAQPVPRVGPQSLCAASVAVASTCLGLLLVQWVRIEELRAELRELKVRGGGQEDAGTRAGEDVTRTRRDLPGHAPRKQRQLGHRRRTFLHLLPLSSHSDDEEDKTLLKWTVGQSQGEGLQVSGHTVTVTRGGLYFIYSQVLYEDTTFVMGHVIKKSLGNNKTSLMKCMKSMADSIDLAMNTCYTAGVQNLESGSMLELSIPRKKAGVILQPHSTFLGIYKI